MYVEGPNILMSSACLKFRPFLSIRRWTKRTHFPVARESPLVPRMLRAVGVLPLFGALGPHDVRPGEPELREWFGVAADTPTPWPIKRCASFLAAVLATAPASGIASLQLAAKPRTSSRLKRRLDFREGWIRCMVCTSMHFC